MGSSKLTPKTEDRNGTTPRFEKEKVVTNLTENDGSFDLSKLELKLDMMEIVEGDLSDDESSTIDPANFIITDLKIATDYDDLLEFKEDGYELYTAHLTAQGIDHEAEQIWPFHVLAKYDEFIQGSETLALEDIAWLKCPKSLGTLPILDGYQVYHEFDLSGPEDESSIFLGAKFGLNPAINKLTLFSAEFDLDNQQNEYLKSTNSIFVKSTTEICKRMNSVVGIQLHQRVVQEDPVVDEKPPINLNVYVNGSEHIGKEMLRTASIENVDEFILDSKPIEETPTMQQENISSQVSLLSVETQEVLCMHEDKLPVAFDNDIDEDQHVVTKQVFDKVIDHGISIPAENENEVYNKLVEERQKLQNINDDLHKRCLDFINKEIDMKSADLSMKRNNTASSTTIVDVNASLDLHLDADREKSLQSLYAQIRDVRILRAKQVEDYEQLALDLQIRLDDKDTKSKQIQDMFFKLKGSTMVKIINSKTGKRFTKKEVLAMEEHNDKKYDVLEKIRIKHIVLRQKLRKVERLLHNKEQLAEGLHVIDFEQLKIENQSYHEKIQAREEEILKLKRKRSSNVQVLTHTREKLYYLIHKNDADQSISDEMDEKLQRMRALISNMHQNQESHMKSVSSDNETRQQFANAVLLIQDYQDRIVLNEELKRKLNSIKEEYKICKSNLLQRKSHLKLDAGKNMSTYKTSKTNYPPKNFLCHPGRRRITK